MEAAVAHPVAVPAGRRNGIAGRSAKQPSNQNALQYGNYIGVLPEPGPEPAREAATAGKNQDGSAVKPGTAPGSAEQPAPVGSPHQPPDIAGGQLEGTKSQQPWAADERESASELAWINCAVLYLIVIVIVGSLMVAYMLRLRLAKPSEDNLTVYPLFAVYEQVTAEDHEGVLDGAADEAASSTSEQRDANIPGAQTFAQGNRLASTDVNSAAEAWTSHGTDTEPFTRQE
ncbi:uncharacterized protein [Dermacentor albipictus]|uniref:uncharacterized protein isoform X2 n=1 Tax=Dermacentor albipictus TaxID=60249 RepID=UPI0031FCE7E8